MNRVPAEVVDVAIAVVRRGDRWLVSRRPAGVHLGGFWEFPGGKAHAGESPEETALRELREECHVEAAVECVLEQREHDYGDRVVRITPVLCRWVKGEPVAAASEECAWVTAAELRDLSMPAVNAGIISAVLAAAEE